MRTIAVWLAVVALLCVGMTKAQVCGPPPAPNPFLPPLTCAAVPTCDAAFCNCVNSSATNRSANVCIGQGQANCAATKGCLVAYFGCLRTVETLINNAPCAAAAGSMHDAIIAAAAGAFAGSSLQRSCAWRACTLLNASTLTSCDLGANASQVCFVNGSAANTTGAPAQSQYVLRGSLRLSGSSYALLLNDPVKRVNLEAAIRVDLAGLLGINPVFVSILNLSLGSLVVDFAVIPGSGKNLTVLLTQLNTATASATWLSNTQSVYSTVSNETIGVLSLAVEEAGGTTAVPGTTTASPNSPPGPTLPGAASATSVVAAFVVAVGIALL